MTLKDLQVWAQGQINNTAQSEVRPDIAVSILQLVDELEDLKEYVEELEAKLAVSPRASI